VYLETNDSERRTQMMAIAKEYQNLLLQFNEDLAAKVINRLAEATK
jgi:hypothetical protein